ncbi:MULTISPECIES: hypothetical protein [Gordonia]|uniref:Lipoprotein n=1 Tax=Gordonia amicalis TaxID=89053 RepID=A0AAE4U9I2_9ACTN|nr:MULTISPECIES: hypothetical protein [Gordonia]KAF0968748.1 hypothetical protein BPODLACK_02777 [Gordonia sp. YY1]MCR8898004.1 hypothetical protein [Gordonia sp. GONU]MCZ0912455.1 hypothetical protein [Gordonia amicalis]MCZ4578020.1 hypothetical protein [Gordonia amicalis]MDV6310817.1 hypothetical protein [Gordonia amicalis]
MNRRQKALVSSFAAITIGVAVVGCGSDTTSSEGTTSATTAVSTETGSATTGSATTGNGDDSGGETFGGLPVYEPSDQVSKAPGSLVLTSPDSVEKIGEFYKNAVRDGDWDIVSETVSRFAASITVKKRGRGASINVAPGTDGSVISISSYPSL